VGIEATTINIDGRDGIIGLSQIIQLPFIRVASACVLGLINPCQRVSRPCKKIEGKVQGKVEQGRRGSEPYYRSDSYLPR
jgi:hypothetical protein